MPIAYKSCCVFSSLPGCYADKIKEIMEDYRSRSNAEKSSFLILVPDIFRGEMLASQLKGLGPFKIGMRSSVFESDAQFDCVIMVDDEDPSFKQEQMPMYETRQVLLMRSYLCGFDIAVVAIAPSVELMALAREGRVKFIDGSKVKGPAARLVDLTNYKFVPGLISPAVRDALQAALKTGQKGILVLNRRGSYRLTRCVDCGEILKCSHCDASLIYSKSEGRFLCRHCTYSVPGDTVCPKCRKYHWRSQGIGVEQVQAELKKLFPTAKVAAFERPSKNEGKLSLPDFDILISTSAVLRFQASLKVQVAAFIDFDAQLNRLDMRSAFNAFSLAQHISAMSHEGVLIQTRHIHHYVLQSLSSGKVKDFYEEELSLRKEFGFMPFKHWVKISWRGKQEKALQEHASKVYNMLSRSLLEDMTTTPPLADVVGRKRDQFRFNVMLQAEQVVPAVALIRSILTKMRQPSRAIVTLNVDP